MGASMSEIRHFVTAFFRQSSLKFTHKPGAPSEGFVHVIRSLTDFREIKPAGLLRIFRRGIRRFSAESKTSLLHPDQFPQLTLEGCVGRRRILHA